MAKTQKGSARNKPFPTLEKARNSINSLFFDNDKHDFAILS